MRCGYITYRRIIRFLRVAFRRSRSHESRWREHTDILFSVIQFSSSSNVSEIQERNFGNANYFRFGVLSVAGYKLEYALLLPCWQQVEVARRIIVLLSSDFRFSEKIRIKIFIFVNIGFCLNRSPLSFAFLLLKLCFPSWTQIIPRTLHDCKHWITTLGSRPVWKNSVSQEAFRVIVPLPPSCKSVFTMPLDTFYIIRFRRYEMLWVYARNKAAPKSAPTSHSRRMFYIHKEGSWKALSVYLLYKICRECRYLIPIHESLTTESGI